jgi:ACS family glucarate transporter-like MFS transporter
VGLLALTATAAYLARVNLSVAGTLLMPEFGLSQAELGRVFSAFLLGYTVCMAPAGLLVDRLDPRRVLGVAAVLWVVGTGLTAAVTGVAALLAVRFLLGVWEAPTFPGAAKIISLEIPQEAQGRANGIVLASIGIGSAIAPWLVTTLMMRWGWRLAVAVTALPAVLVAAAWLPRRNRAVPPAAGVPRKMRIPSSASFVLLTLSYTLQGYVGYIFVFWFYLYLVQVRHFDLLRSALLTSLPWLLSIAAIPAGGWLSDRLVRAWGLTWGRRAVPLAALLAAGILLAVGARTENGYAAAVYLALSTACVLCVEGPFWAAMMEISGPDSGAGGGFMNLGSNIGGMISPALTPWLASLWGWQPALDLAAGCAVLAALLWLGVSPAGKSEA